MNEEFEETVLIKNRTGEQIVVPKHRLIKDSAKFRELFVTLNFEEHEIDDFSPEAVEIFLTLLDTKVLEHLELNMFRELHKLSVVFEVNWLTESCRVWLKGLINTASTREEKTYIFEECWYIADRLNNEVMMDVLICVLAHKDNTALLSDYLSDISVLETGRIDALLKLGGVDTDLFLQSVLQNLENKKELNLKLKYLLNGINSAYSRERNEVLFLEVMDTISNLPEISVNDMRFVQKLMSDTARLVRSRKEERKNRKTVVWDVMKDFVLFDNCNTVDDVLKAITDDRVTSMFMVVELLFYVCRLNVLNSEELQVFLTSLENLCRQKKLQKVSRQFICNITTTLNYSEREESKLLINLLNKIKNNNLLSTHNGNVIIKCDKNLDTEYLFTYKHPLSANCTQIDSKCGFILRESKEDNFTIRLCTEREEYENTGIHTHDDISASDMYWYSLLSGRCGSNRVTVPGWWGWGWWGWWGLWGWKYWLPDFTDWKGEGDYVAYNVGEYTVAKQQ
ncbi:hypothetical protein ACHWQZ_G014834 [Mnemiopsis leidyi]